MQDPLQRDGRQRERGDREQDADAIENQRHVKGDPFHAADHSAELEPGDRAHDEEPQNDQTLKEDDGVEEDEFGSADLQGRGFEMV